MCDQCMRVIIGWYRSAKQSSASPAEMQELSRAANFVKWNRHLNVVHATSGYVALPDDMVVDTYDKVLAELSLVTV